MDNCANAAGPVGVCLRPEYDEYSLQKLGEYAEMAEQRGFHSVWLAESWGLDAIALLSHIGARTHRVKLGTAIVNVFSRSPALLAMASVTLNDLYDSRFILGLGTSTKALVEDWHGMRFVHPVTRLRDAVHIVRQAASGEVVAYEGRAVSLKGYRLRLKPKSPPPPIYLAALGPESKRLVAEVADGWIPYLLPLRGLRDSARAIHEAANSAGRAPGAVTIAPMIVTAVDEDGSQAREAAREHIAFYLGAMGPFYRAFVGSFGFEAVVEEVRAAWAAQRYKDARGAVTDEMVAELAVAGTPRECREQLARYRAEGADLPILTFPGVCTNRMVELALNTMAGSEASRMPARS